MLDVHSLPIPLRPLASIRGSNLFSRFQLSTFLPLRSLGGLGALAVQISSPTSDLARLCLLRTPVRQAIITS